MSDHETLPLTKFAQAGDVKAMRELLATGTVDREDIRHALEVSCSNWTGYEASLQALIAYGVDVNDKLPNGHFPLEISIGRCNAERVRILLDAGADVHAAIAWDGQYAVHLAAHTSPPEVLRVILNAGANPNQTDEKGRTPADHAIENTNAECLKLLVEAGADLPSGVEADSFWTELRERLKEYEVMSNRIPSVERAVRATIFARGINSAMSTETPDSHSATGAQSEKSAPHRSGGPSPL